MTIYYQHVGEQMASRDFPRTLGSKSAGLKRFSFEDIAPFLQHLSPMEVLDIKATVSQLAPTGFQIWGIPSGAQRVLQNMTGGDFLMLLESTDFTYVGQVLHRVQELCPALSDHLWHEQRFPIIILLQGELVSYSWSDFKAYFKFDANYHMRGNTMSLSAERVGETDAKTEEAFIATVLTTKGINVFDMERDFQAFSHGLQTHLRLVKQREAQQKFKRSVIQRYGRRCMVCGLDEPSALDAAHIIPKEHKGSDDPRNGLALCASHHRMFDAQLFAIEPGTRSIVVSKGYDAHKLRISQPSISDVPEQPHFEALQWRWRMFSGA